MAKTFWTPCWVSPTFNQDTALYVKEKWGVPLRGISEDELNQGNSPSKNMLAIVVRDYPEIMDELRQSVPDDDDPYPWQILRISEYGISLYLVNYSGKSEDGEHDLWNEVFIFIPISNVIAIHNITEQFFINEALSRAKI